MKILFTIDEVDKASAWAGESFEDADDVWWYFDANSPMRFADGTVWMSGDRTVVEGTIDEWANDETLED